MKAMKFWLLMAVMVVAIAAHARKNDDPEMRHVRLTMMDGKQIEGYIPKKYMGWALEYQVRLDENPDGKKAKKYDAEKVTKMEWLALTEEHPEGEVWEHCQTIARNSIRTVKEDRLMELLYRGKNASVYQVHVFLPGNGINTGNSWATWYALKPNGQERAFILYNATLGKMGSLDRQFKDQKEYEGLKDYILEWWNKDKSLARKQLNDGVAIFSHTYDEWKAASSKQ